MIYLFKPGVFGNHMTTLGKEISMLYVGQRTFSDFDLRYQCHKFVEQLHAIKDGLANAPLSPSLLAQWERCEKRLESLKERETEVGVALLVELETNLLAELNQGTFLALDSANGELFEQKDPFGDSVSALFPQATTDIYEGVRCLALERYTAAVFHLMRAAEHALRYLAAEVGIDKIDEKDFGQLVQETRVRHNALKSRDPEKKWTADALASLDLFKDAWRNPVSHAREDQYTEERARDVYNGTRAFMQSLTRRAAR